MLFEKWLKKLKKVKFSDQQKKFIKLKRKLREAEFNLASYDRADPSKANPFFALEREICDQEAKLIRSKIELLRALLKSRKKK